LLKGKKYSNISEPQCFLQHHHIKFFLVRREWALPGGALLNQYLRIPEQRRQIILSAEIKNQCPARKSSVDEQGKPTRRDKQMPFRKKFQNTSSTVSD
jgi:hypothetical protein